MNDTSSNEIKSGLLPAVAADRTEPKRGVFKVAEMAGVSTATVSRTFNDPSRVRKDVRERVMEAAIAAGYVPNPAARALRSQRTRVIGAVIPTLDHAIYARLVDGMQRQFAEDDYTVIVLSVGFDNSHIFDAVRRIGTSFGYTGHGVITSAICARALAGLVTGAAPDSHVVSRSSTTGWNWPHDGHS